MKARLLPLGFIVGTLFSGPSLAETWPAKYARIIVPYGPGGGVDSFTRPIATSLSMQLGQQFVVDNRPGAGGTIGVNAAARSRPDGYTFLAGGVHQMMAESLYTNRGYDMDKDFTLVAITAIVPNVLVVNPKVPFKDVGELIAYARANPDKLTYCSSGNGTSQHIIAEMFKMATHVSLLHIPHRGTAAAMTSLLGGQCDMMFDGMGTSAQQINGAKLRPLAVTTTKRSTEFPAIPTMQEAGGPPMDAGTWYGLWAPAGTPPEIVRKMRHEVSRALDSQMVKDTWKAQGADLSRLPADQLQSFGRQEIVRWTKVNQSAGIKID